MEARSGDCPDFGDSEPGVEAICWAATPRAGEGERTVSVAGEDPADVFVSVEWADLA